MSPTWGRPGSWSFLLPSRLQPRGQFPLACLAEHVAQLPDALSVIGHSQAALGLFEFKLDLPDRGVRFAVRFRAATTARTILQPTQSLGYPMFRSS